MEKKTIKALDKIKGLYPYGLANIGLGPKVLKAIGLSFFISLIARIIGLFKEAVVAGMFGLSAVVDVYVLGLLTATFFVGPVAGSISTPLTRELRRLHQDNDAQQQQQLVTRILYLCLLIMIIIIISLASLSEWLLYKYDLRLLESFKTSKIPNYLLMIGLLSVITVLADATLSAQKRFGTQNGIKLCVPLVIIVSCLSAPTHLLIEALFFGTIAGYFVEAILASFFIRKFVLLPKLNPFASNGDDFWHLMRQWPTLAVSGFVMSGCLIVDQTMAVLAGEGAVAMISFGNRLTLGLLSLVAVLWTVLFPQFIDQVVSRQFQQLRRSLIGLNIVVIIVGLIGCSILAAMSEWITSALYERGAFTEDDTEVVSQIQIFYFLHIPFYISILINARILNAFEKTELYLSGNVALLLCNIVLNLAFIESFGVHGIALATLTSYVAMALVWFCAAFWLVQNAYQNKI